MTLKQAFFDFESVTNQTNFSFNEPVEYYVLYINADTYRYVNDNDSFFGDYKTEYKSYTLRIGHLNKNCGTSNFLSIVRQLNSKYNLDSTPEDEIRRMFNIPPDEHIKFFGVKHYIETIKEILVVKKCNNG